MLLNSSARSSGGGCSGLRKTKLDDGTGGCGNNGCILTSLRVKVLVQAAEGEVPVAAPQVERDLYGVNGRYKMVVEG